MFVIHYRTHDIRLWFTLKMLAMVISFKQERSLRIIIHAIHHSYMHWNEMIEPLNMSRSILTIYARTLFCLLSDTQDFNEMAPLEIQVNLLIQHKKTPKFDRSKSSFKLYF